MISKPKIRKFRLSEILQFMNDVLKIFTKYNATTLLVADEVTDLKAKTTALDAGFKIESGSAISDELVVLDTQRDDCVIGIKWYAQAYSRHYDATYRVAAESILGSMAKYGNDIPLLNYQAETSTVASLCDEWTKNTVLSKAITKLGLTAWAAQLKLYNDQFNTRYLARVSEQGAVVHTDNLALRDKLRLAYTTLIGHTEARATLDKTGLYTPLINELNVLVGKYNTLVDARAKKGDDKKTDSGIDGAAI